MNLKYRLCKLFFDVLFISLIVFSPVLSFSEEAFKIYEYREIKQWINTFFHSDAQVKHYSTEKLSLSSPLQIVQGLNQNEEDSHDYKCNKKNSLCITITFNFQIIAKNEIKTLEGLDPDSFVDLIDYKTDSVHRIFSIGSVGSIIGAFWDINKIILYGFEEENGFITICDLDTKTKKTYYINKKFRKQGVSKEKFLIKKYG